MASVIGVPRDVADDIRAAAWAAGYNIGVERAMTGQPIAPAPNPYREQ